ncbi:MAG: DUF4325 domain-containing protein [Pseudomonadota bacterium]|nr:DUF4325 domain-containing protein [Pseudomonadota bacterium]
MREINPTTIDAALTELVDEHPASLVQAVAKRLDISRPTVLKRVRALIDEGYLVRSGGKTRPFYRKGLSKRASFEYDRAGLAEDRVWSRDVAPLLQEVPDNVIEIAHHGLTEMVNNAIDHSIGTRVTVYVDRDRAGLTMRVSDNGVGIFRKITDALDLPDERLALLELSKGKLTTDPSRHSGEGIFFTSRMFDRFQIWSGELVFDHDHEEGDDLLFERSAPKSGTTVHMEIGVASVRNIADVFAAYSSGPDDYSFARTVVPVRLARVGGENLVSRSQAKRLMQRVDRFRIVMLDFEGVERIGQAFADEIFRVFANAHPDVELIPCHAVPEVQQMIRRAEVLRDEEALRTGR